MIHFSLFSGIGGFELASEWMGWNNYLSCELADFPNKVLKHYWPKAYHHRDIKTLKQKEMQYAQAFKDFEKFGSVDFENEVNDDEVEIKFEEDNKNYYEDMDLPSVDEDEYTEGDEVNGVIKEEIDVDDI